MQPSLQIGILGGGQLARMLVQAADRLGLSTHVFCGDITDPASQVCANVKLGRLEDAEALRKFFQSVDLVLFENEFLDCAKLRSAARELPVYFLPTLEVIALVQDKLEQKKLLERLKIRTASYTLVDKAAKLTRPAVLKWSRLGYDGKGVLICDETTPLERIERFLADARTRGGQTYAEELIPFRRELAVVAVRSRQGEFLAYPLVISEQEHGICKKVYGPATNLGVPQELETQAHDAARKLAEEIDLVGAFALEFFEDPTRGLLVNEIAPRVHNTGHYTMDACTTSQFENHLRACLELPLGKIHVAPAFAMVNLLGPDHVKPGPAVAPVGAPDLHPHWYGKATIQPRRKMGHVNAVAQSIDSLPITMAKLDQYDKVWMSNQK